MYVTSLHPLIKTPEVNGKCKWLRSKVCWSSLYDYPIEKKDGDISWRLLHNILVTPNSFHKWNVIPSPNCPWCPSEEGNIIHMMFLCKTTESLWNFTASKIILIRNNPKKLSLKQALIGYPLTTPPDRLCNFLLVLTKSTIYKSYMVVIKNQSPTIPAYLNIFKRRLQ